MCPLRNLAIGQKVAVSNEPDETNYRSYLMQVSFIELAQRGAVRYAQCGKDWLAHQTQRNDATQSRL